MGALWVVTANSIKNTNLRGLSQTLSTLNLRLLHEHLPLIFPSRNFAVEYTTVAICSVLPLEPLPPTAAEE